jgi:hypothetical protein
MARPGIFLVTREERVMAFVNEYASDEDIEKYGLKEIWDKYYPFRKGKYFGGNRPAWTIDRERNAFLMVVARGTGEEGNQVSFLLWWDGAHVVARMKQKGGSADLEEVPFYRIWHLVKLATPSDLPISREDILDALKDALTVYGYWGVQEQVPNTIVKFSF